MAEGLFTVDFIVSIGGVDSPEIQEMIHVLNVVTSVWGRDATTCMVKFLNLVKSKTDELAVTLHGPISTRGSRDANDDAEESSASVLFSSGKEGGPAGVAESDLRKKTDTKAKLKESEKKALEQRLKESEANLALAQKEIKELKCGSSKRDGQSHSKIVSSGGGGRDLDILLEAYNNRCIELDNLRDESIRHSMWFSEQNSIYTLNKQKLENRVHEKEKILQDLEKQKSGIGGGFLPSGVREASGALFLSPPPSQLHLLHNLSTVVIGNSIEESSKTCCYVPTRCGHLVPLKFVYTSWKRDGVSSDFFLDHVPPFPVFRGSPPSKESLILSDPTQILLLHSLFSTLEIPNEPPFKLQFKPRQDDTNHATTIAVNSTSTSEIIMEDSDDQQKWTDIVFTDQVRLASIMYYMKHNQRDANSRMIEHCIVQHSQLLVTISLEQCTYAFEVRETKNEPMEHTPSRLVVMDGSYELYN